MSINFSANQITGPTGPSRHYAQYPKRRTGFSTFHADDKGHLLPNVPRRRESPWGTFVGTWSMPRKMPGNRQTNPTARSDDAQVNLEIAAEQANQQLSGGLKKSKMPPPLHLKTDQESSDEPLPQQPEDGTGDIEERRPPPPKTALSHRQETDPCGRNSRQDIAWPNQAVDRNTPSSSKRDHATGLATPLMTVDRNINGSKDATDVASPVNSTKPEIMAKNTEENTSNPTKHTATGNQPEFREATPA